MYICIYGGAPFVVGSRIHSEVPTTLSVSKTHGAHTTAEHIKLSLIYIYIYMYIYIYIRT